ncbi:hypothetical protein [Crenothrix sp.]|uniref:hypothetical protein n=1 Tax=Crenothrix sp. TaxID=3100433 RepID=UPI00374D7E56
MMMNKKLIVISLFAVGSIAATSLVSAHPWYIGPANAAGSCGDCHVGGTRSKTFQPGLLELFPINQKLAVQDKIKAIFKLTDAQRLPAFKKWDKIINPKPTTPDTAPVAKVGAAVYTYTIGAKPLVIQLMVKDAEHDTYTIDQDFDGAKAKMGTFKNKMSTATITWSGIPAAYAGQTFPMELSVKEDQRKKGRILKSNAVKFKVKILAKKK